MEFCNGKSPTIPICRNMGTVSYTHLSGSLCFVHIQWDFRCSSILFCHEEIFIDKNAVVLHCNAEHGIRYIEKSQTTGGMDL